MLRHDSHQGAQAHPPLLGGQSVPAGRKAGGQSRAGAGAGAVRGYSLEVRLVAQFRDRREDGRALDEAQQSSGLGMVRFDVSCREGKDEDCQFGSRRALKRRSALTVLLNVLLHALVEEIDRLGAHFGAHVPVEGGGHSALLDVAQDVAAAVKHTLAFLREEAGDEVGAEEARGGGEGVRGVLGEFTAGLLVVGVRLVAAQDQAALHVALDLAAKVCAVLTEPVDRERLLEDVGGVGTARQSTQGRQVAAVGAHRLHHEDAPGTALS